MIRNLLWLVAGVILGFVLAVAMKSREVNRLNAANRELASQVESEKHQLASQKHEMELQRQLTEEATATIRLATGQLNGCYQALHRASSKLRSQ